MLRSLLPRTRSAFESRTQVWREVGLGSEIDPAAARRNKGGALIALVLIAAVLIGFTDRKTLFPGYGLEVRIGLAAQQVLGNLLAGLVLITNRPFRVGERVRLQAGVLAGRTEGVVGQLGLFYTTLVSGADRILIPNGVLIQCAVTPLREPEKSRVPSTFRRGDLAEGGAGDGRGVDLRAAPLPTAHRGRGARPR
jgi:small-conductance mechanosensitive channel